MESTTPRDPRDFAAELGAAEQARSRLVDRLRLPAGHHLVLALGVAIQIATAGVGIARQSASGLGIVGAGLAGFAAMAAVELWRFRRANGVWVGGLASRAVLGTGTLASLAYGGALALAVVGAFAAAWWLVVLATVAGGIGYAAGARQWWRAYVRDPATHARGDSALVLGVLAVLACLGAAALVVLG